MHLPLILGCLLGTSWAQQVGAPIAPAKPAPAAVPAAAGAQTSLVAYENFIEIQRAGHTARERVISVPQLLGPGDRIHTYRKGSATIEFKDGSKVQLGPFSIFTIQEDTPNHITLNLTLGKLRAFVAKLKNREFAVKTALAVASVRGTIFDMEVVSPKLVREATVQGFVAVKDTLGNEAGVGAGHSVEATPEGLGQIRDILDRGERGRETRQSKDSKESGQEHLKAALEREVGFQLGREAIETAAAFEQKSAIYQAGKALVDAFGQRVRLEQYITRPDPTAFKFVALNFRQNRLDFGAFEVWANKALPDDLSQTGNLWFSFGPTPPPYYAVKERLIMSNTQDSYVQLGVDGQSVQSTFQSNIPSCDATGCTYASAKSTFYQTIFGNQYEFLNGDPTTLNNIWAGAARPLDAAGMVAHMQPVQIAVENTSGNSIGSAITGGSSLATYWDNALLVTNPANNSGKGFVDSFYQPDPALAHFVQTRYYANFQEPSGNTSGILDFGEANTYPGLVYGYPTVAGVFLHKQQLMNGTTPVNFPNTWEPAQNVTIFSDKNGTGQPGGTNPTLATPVTDPSDPRLFAFAVGNYRDYLQTDNYIIDDNGNILNFNNPAALGSAGSENAVSGIFDKLNFEQVLTSSVFPGRKIDLVISPDLFLKSGLIPAN